MFDIKKYSFIYFVYFGVVWDRSINVSFALLCLPKWRSPCNQNSLNALWMLGTDFCAWVQTWLGICVGALRSPSLAGETCQLQIVFSIGYIQFSPVTQSCPTLCNPRDCSTPGLLVLHHLLEPVQIHIYWVSDAIQPSHLLSSPFPPAFSVSQHQGLFNVSSSYQMAKVLECHLQHSVLPMNIQEWFVLGLTGLISL